MMCTWLSKSGVRAQGSSRRTVPQLCPGDGAVAGPVGAHDEDVGVAAHAIRAVGDPLAIRRVRGRRHECAIREVRQLPEVLPAAPDSPVVRLLGLVVLVGAEQDCPVGRETGVVATAELPGRDLVMMRAVEVDREQRAAVGRLAQRRVVTHIEDRAAVRRHRRGARLAAPVAPRKDRALRSLAQVEQLELCLLDPVLTVGQGLDLTLVQGHDKPPSGVHAGAAMSHHAGVSGQRAFDLARHPAARRRR